MTLCVHIIKDSGVCFWTKCCCCNKKEKKKGKEGGGRLNPKPNKTSNTKSYINQSLKSDW